MSIPRIVASVLTFPGVIIHELGHKIFCNLLGVRVYKVCYFRFGQPAGYVIHEFPHWFSQSFFISVGPLITGTIIAGLSFQLSKNFLPTTYGHWLLIWFGLAVAMDSFPSCGDAKTLWQATNKNVTKNLLALIGYPVILLLWLINNLSIIWLDLIYALVLFELIAVR